MIIDPAGREYAYFGIGDLPASPPAQEVYLAGAWHPLAWWDVAEGDPSRPDFERVVDKLGEVDRTFTLAAVTAGTARVARILVAGPDAAGESAVVLPLGRTDPRVRSTGTPELLVRPAAPIDVEPV